MAPQTGAMMRPLAVMMSRDFRAISADAPLVDAADMMRSARVGALLVSSSGSFVGVVSERDLVRKAMARGADPTQERVRAVMSSPIISIEYDRSAHEASDLMAEKGIRHLVVTQEGTIVGMISVRDLLRYFKNWGTL
jgi:CBS domain-containing protein